MKLSELEESLKVYMRARGLRRRFFVAEPHIAALQRYLALLTNKDPGQDISFERFKESCPSLNFGSAYFMSRSASATLFLDWSFKDTFNGAYVTQIPALDNIQASIFEETKKFVSNYQPRMVLLAFAFLEKLFLSADVKPSRYETMLRLESGQAERSSDVAAGPSSALGMR